MIIYMTLALLIGKFFDYLSAKSAFIHKHVNSRIIKNIIFHLYKTIA